MNIVLDFKSVLLFQLFYQIRKAGCNYVDSLEQNLDSQSQETDSDMDQGEEYRRYKISNRHRNYDYEKENQILKSNDYDECNFCACNKCDDPPDCCIELCKSCPKALSEISQIQMMALSQMPQLSMPISPESPMTLAQFLQIPLGQNSMTEMQLPQMQVSQMQLPQMQMPHMQIPDIQVSKLQIPLNQMSRMPTPEDSFSFSDQNLIYFPLSSNILNFFKNFSLQVPTASKTPQINNSTSVTPAATESVTTDTTVAAKTLITTLLPVRVTPDEQTRIHKTRLKQIENNKNLLEAAIRNALGAFSNSMRKTVDKSNSRYNRYVLASALRRTKPVISNTDPSRFGILPIPNNIAASLMLETRNAKGIRT